MATQSGGIRVVEPSMDPMSYSNTMPHDLNYNKGKKNDKNCEFDTQNPDELLTENNNNNSSLYESHVLSFVNNLRSRFRFIDKCFMIFGILLFIIIAIISFIFMLPLMVWIVLGWIVMFISAFSTIFLRAYCPRSFYNILIDVFNIPHSKT